MTASNHARSLPGANRRSALSRRLVLRSLAAVAPAALAACGGTEPPGPAPRSVGPSAPAPTPTPVPVHPLTGQTVADAGLVRRRIVAVKIDNAPEARPQFGLGVADLVYEQLAEGGLTRFLAMFLTQEPERVGPVRSARLTDMYLGQEWDFLLAYAGAGRTTSRLLAEALVPSFKAPELGEPLQGTSYFRDGSRIVPHNLFVKVAGIREEARKDPAIPREVEIRPFPFQPAPAEAGPLRTIRLPYVAAAAVTWSYDPGANVWKRTMAGQPHVEALNGQQIETDNVLVQYVNLFTTRAVETDSAGNPVLDAELRGEHKLRLFHSGQVFEGTWHKESDRAKTAYRGADGNPLPFRPGRLWIHIVPLDFSATWT